MLSQSLKYSFLQTTESYRQYVEKKYGEPKDTSNEESSDVVESGDVSISDAAEQSSDDENDIEQPQEEYANEDDPETLYNDNVPEDSDDEREFRIRIDDYLEEDLL